MESIRVVSYNIHYGVSPSNTCNIGDISKFLSSLDADIICLQEVDQDCKRSFHTNQPSMFYHYLSMHTVFQKTINTSGGQNGNLIMSKYPIISYNNIHLPSSKYPRKAMDILIKTPCNTIRVLNTHLGLSKEIRQKQVQMLTKIIHSSTYPIILTGDFNTSNVCELDPFFYFLKDSATTLKQQTTPTFINEKYNNRIDYILFAKTFNPKNYTVSSVEYSDHHPIFSDIHF